MLTRQPKNTTRGVLAACAVVGCMLLSACDGTRGESAPLPADRANWNLVVLLLDALPANGVGAWGYDRDVTPQLDAFAASGIRFAQAYAGASYTLASVSSIFTGLSPAAHGVVGLTSNVLDEKHQTLAEAFRARGFTTGAFSCNPHITVEGGFDQGFDEFRHYKRGRLDFHSVPRALEGESIEWWKAHAGERRLMYVHVLPPHQPYDAPKPHRSLFGADKTERELGFTEYLVDADKRGTVERGSALARAIRSRYDAGLHAADAFLGRYLTKLQNTPGGKSTVYCILSDHGEAFAEHGRLLHGTTVFDEMTHVPLVLSWPGSEPGVVEEIVSTVHLAPTLCELFDIPFARGESFLPATWEDYESPPVLSRSVGNSPIWSLRTNRWSFLKQPSTKLRLLYDRKDDRGETIELLARKQSWKQRRGGEEFSPQSLQSLAVELSTRMTRTLVEHRELGKGFRHRQDTTHRDALGDLGYNED